jgi:FMN-dependent NADH-azoreductase
MLLRIDSSANGARSVSRSLGDHFARQWQALHSGAMIETVDLVDDPPPFLTGHFIEAAFTPPALRRPDLDQALTYSDAMLSRIEAADTILITVPMVNFGIPAVLKAWFDQIIRIGVSFGTQDDPAHPYVPLLRDRPVIVVTARGNADIVPDGKLAQCDMLTPHLALLLSFIGLTNIHCVHLAGTEQPHATWQTRRATAQAELERLARL